jgi:hypothetical protein
MVQERGRDPEAFKAKLDELVAEFRKKMRVDESSGSQTRVAISFGLIYAAGCLAKEYGVLPKGMKMGTAATAAYELNRSAVDPTSPLDRLLRFARRPDLVRSKGGHWPRSSKNPSTNPAGYIWESRPGRMELLITEKALDSTFPYARLMLKNSEVMARMIPDGDHQRVKRRLPGIKKRTRVFCFRLFEDDMV